MARYDVMKETYTEIRVLEKPALFSGLRLNRNTVPDGMYLYEVRHDDYGKGDPVQIGKGVLVNFWGSILTCEPLNLEEDGRLDIDPEQDWDYLEGKNCSIREFMEKYSGSIADCHPKRPPVPYYPASVSHIIRPAINHYSTVLLT